MDHFGRFGEAPVPGVCAKACAHHLQLEVFLFETIPNADGPVGAEFFH